LPNSKKTFLYWECLFCKIVSEFVGNHSKDSDYWYALNKQEQAELEQAIHESEDESNHVDHNEIYEKEDLLPF
jgi:hypothetical protein